MRLLLVSAALAWSATAHADRIPIVSIGTGFELRFTGASWTAANEATTPTPLAMSRVTLAFEDPPLPPPPVGVAAGTLRLVPELFVGAALGAQLGEGYFGAGVRGEAAFAAHSLRTSLYLAPRVLAIGGNRGGAGELGFGEYIVLRGATRFGWEGFADVRPRDRAGDRALSAGVQLYLGWALH